jgi:hypothetical protein
MTVSLVPAQRAGNRSVSQLATVVRCVRIATDPDVRTTAAERRRAAENAIASARLESLDPSSLSAAIDAYVHGERTIDELIADALAPDAEKPSVG